MVITWYTICMKAITVNVSEPVYRDFQRFAQERDRTTSELIREAMEEYLERRIRSRPSLNDVRPASAGGVLRPLGVEDDLLDEMLNG
jgi:predicted transcriptional regulator